MVYAVVVAQRELRDLLDLAACAAQQVRLHEGANPLSDALDGARSAVEAELKADAPVLV